MTLRVSMMDNGLALVVDGKGKVAADCDFASFWLIFFCLDCGSREVILEHENRKSGYSGY